MNDQPASLKPLASTDGMAAFEEPWQAEILAMADTLVQRGLFTANCWSDALGLAIKEANDRNEPDTQYTYYQCALIALERLVAAHSVIKSADMTERRMDWENAYLSTPHGHPVHLK
ncbi:MAG: nitrile hydratase accessory protein [marine bacterium B5-7]|nr:MAG: nitrile hydratase accessory protein [marine bacterium B5-7]